MDNRELADVYFQVSKALYDQFKDTIDDFKADRIGMSEFNAVTAYQSKCIEALDKIAFVNIEQVA